MAGRSGEESVLAVIGDASMTPGWRWKGCIMQATADGTSRCSHDNEMSIAESVAGWRPIWRNCASLLYQNAERKARSLLKRSRYAGRALTKAAGSCSSIT